MIVHYRISRTDAPVVDPPTIPASFRWIKNELEGPVSVQNGVLKYQVLPIRITHWHPESGLWDLLMRHMLLIP